MPIFGDVSVCHRFKMSLCFLCVLICLSVIILKSNYTIFWEIYKTRIDFGTMMYIARAHIHNKLKLFMFWGRLMLQDRLNWLIVLNISRWCLCEGQLRCYQFCNWCRLDCSKYHVILFRSIWIFYVLSDLKTTIV